MKGKLNVYIILLSLVSLSASGQLRTYLSIETGPVADIINVKDPGNYLSPAFARGSITGVSVSQEIIEDLSIESGIYFHTYKTGINFSDKRSHQPDLENFRSALVPIRISYRITNSRLLFSITPRLGYMHGFIQGQPAMHDFSSHISVNNNTTFRYEQTDHLPIVNQIRLIEAGASIVYRFNNQWQVSLAVSHFIGLTEIKFSAIDYFLSGNSFEAIYSNEGDRIQSLLSLQVPLSNVWENKSSRLQKRIENSRFPRQRINNRLKWYFGGNVAALWRSFYTSNPAIGPYPSEERGIFRYANLYTGGYAGLILENNFGADIGAYYQRSSTFFSIIFDEQNEQITRTSAPYFIEIPLTLRYFHRLNNTSFSLVPNIAASLLTHFAGQTYNSGSGNFDFPADGRTEQTFSYASSRLTRYGFNVKTGCGIEYDLPMNFPLMVVLNINYNLGYIDIDRIHVNTSLDEIMPSVSDANSITYDGSGMLLSLGFRIRADKLRRSCRDIPLQVKN
ncbi:MAG: PorT family protein [Bacteroidales bacterium]|nr:PorT family protein [Bacteroidales bacterium]